VDGTPGEPATPIAPTNSSTAFSIALVRMLELAARHCCASIVQNRWRWFYPSPKARVGTMVTSILWPMLAYIGWVFLLYAWLTVARQRAVKRGEVEYASFAHGEEPPDIDRITRNLANQFELPVIFYAVVVLLIATGRVTTIDVAAAWVFVAGRVIHTLVQTLTDNVPLRGQVFLINFAGVVVLLGHVVLLALEGLGR
jgi:hypothetical protein